MRNRIRDLASRLTGTRPAAEPAPTDDVPCVPCQQKQGVRQFSLNDAPPPVPDDFVPVFHTELSYTVLDGQVVLHDPERDASHVLNAGAAIVWASIDERSTAAELVADIAKSTGESVETIDRDVRMALANFISAGILHPQQPLAPPTDPAAELAAAEHAAAAQADADRRRAASRSRVARALEHQAWCPNVGARQVGATTVLVRTNDAEIASHLDKVLPSLPAAASAASTISVVDRGRDGTHRYRIIIDDEVRMRRSTAGEAADHVLTELNLLAIANTPDKMLFHGGAVERDGQVVAVLGVSGQGKSTLTAALVQRGWNYLSDELVIVDPATYHVDPYPKALDLSEESVALLDSVRPISTFATGKVQVSPESLGTTSKGGRLVLLVMLAVADEEDSGDPTAEVNPLAAIESLQQLMMNTFRETMALPDALERQARLCTTVPSVALARTSLDRSCALIEQTLRSVAPVPDAHELQP
jgi:hypothetical protein